MQEDNASSAPPEPQSIGFYQRVEQSLLRLKDERARTLFQLAIAALDQSKVERAQQKFDALPESEKAKDGLKVSDIPSQLAFASPLAVAFGFNELPSSNVLGIGRNSTHLLYCAEALGHRVTVAAPANPLHDQLLNIYGLNHFVQTRTANLPAETFDAIVSLNLGHASQAAWAAFLRPLVATMKSGANVFMTVLRRPLAERNFDPETALAMFERLGAQVSRKNFSIILNKKQVESLIDGTPAAAKAASGAEDLNQDKNEPAPEPPDETMAAPPAAGVGQAGDKADQGKTVAIVAIIGLVLVAGLLTAWLLK